MGLSTPVMSQDATPIETLDAPKKRVRIVEPIPMWVEAEKLRIRDNPYAGDVIGMLEMGQKVKIHEQADDWIRISANGKPTKWVNKNFLSTNRVTWSNYGFNTRGRVPIDSNYDVDLKRIKIKEVKDVKVYAAHIKAATNDGRIIITRHDFRNGPYFEKRLVHCGDDGKASHVRMLGEGYNSEMMERDPRGVASQDSANDEYVVDQENTSILNKAIADFTCEAKNI